MYPEEEYENLPQATPAEMYRTDLSQAVIQLKALGISNVLRFSFPSPPPAENLLLALELLYALGIIDNHGDLTKPLGTTIAEFPLSPLHAKTLITSGEFFFRTFLVLMMNRTHVSDFSLQRILAAPRKYPVS